ncbi:MAG: cob(I)yrinic acid a,c-diamide adenosyltransferase [Bacteroidales bacterium]|nr:cob(I)yrinic acid a,c-diamide adenosyltransferase [Bacteroidales bacterium]
MKVYTGKGDAGQTSLVGGARVSKASSRVCAYGDIDELISFLGLLRAKVPAHNEVLRRVQCELMNLSAWIASEGHIERLKAPDPLWVEVLECQIDAWTAELPPLKAFVIPGVPAPSSLCHVCRTVCRRAERAVVALEDSRPEIGLACRYLNRLSDMLFTLARLICIQSGKDEDFWI